MSLYRQERDFCEWVKSLTRVRLLVTQWTIAHQAPPSMEFSRQEYWSRLPFPSPGDLPDPGIEPGSPTLQADALPSEPPENPMKEHGRTQIGSSAFLENRGFIIGCRGLGKPIVKNGFSLKSEWIVGLLSEVLAKEKKNDLRVCHSLHRQPS